MGTYATKELQKGKKAKNGEIVNCVFFEHSLRILLFFVDMGIETQTNPKYRLISVKFALILTREPTGELRKSGINQRSTLLCVPPPNGQDHWTIFFQLIWWLRFGSSSHSNHK